MKQLDEYVEERAERFILQCPYIEVVTRNQHSRLHKFMQDFIRSIVMDTIKELSETSRRTSDKKPVVKRKDFLKFVHDIELAKTHREVYDVAFLCF